MDLINPEEDLALETVKERAVKGVVALSGRYFFLYLISFFAQVLLGALLSSEEWGIFAVVSAVVNFLIYFSDIGLAAALIQNKSKISRKDLKTTFFVQQSLVFILLIIIFGLSGFIKSFYRLSPAGIFLLYAFAVSFFLSSLKTIPTVLLERGLKFEKIAIASILETLVYNFVLVFLAWKGFGIRSFAWAILIRGGTGLIIIYSLQPWRPGFALSKESLKKLLRFGIPYQLNTFIAIMKDDGLTIVLGKILGLEAMGILTWAQKWAQMPLRIFMDQVTKVTFPAFSRMQESREHLQRSLSRSIFFICFFVYPSLIGLIIISPNLIMIIPRYEKWTPALLPLALIGINSIFSAVSTQLTNFLNSTGRIKTTFKLMVMWLSLTWAIIPFLAFKFGANGAALGYALLGASSVVVFYISKRIINYSLWESAGKPLVASLTMAGVLLILQLMLPVNVLSTLMLIVTGGIIYGLMIYFLVGRSLTDDVKKGVKTIFTK